MAARNLSTFSLNDLSSELAGLVYAGEKTGRCSVSIPRNHYLVVLALRFILHYTDIYNVDGDGGMDQRDHDTWQVFWTVDEPGTTSIYLAKKSVKLIVRTGSGEELAVEVQKEFWHKLATLEGNEEITGVRLNTGLPYSTEISLSPAEGIRRLIEDAAHVSKATPSQCPFTCLSVFGRLTLEVMRNEDFCNYERGLAVKLDIDGQDRVSDVNLRVNVIEPLDYDDDDEYRYMGY